MKAENVRQVLLADRPAVCAGVFSDVVVWRVDPPNISLSLFQDNSTFFRVYFEVPQGPSLELFVYLKRVFVVHFDPLYKVSRLEVLYGLIESGKVLALSSSSRLRNYYPSGSEKRSLSWGACPMNICHRYAMGTQKREDV